MWITLLIIAITIFVYLLNRRVENLERSRGRGYSHSFTISALDAVLSNKMFGELSGIKSSEEGKSWGEWTEFEKKKWKKEYYFKIVDKVYVHMAYLASEDAYFIKTKKGSTLILPELGKRYLYQSCLIGEDDGHEDYLAFGLVERVIKHNEGKIRVITGYLRENDGEDIDKSKTIVLFDFPFGYTDMTEAVFKDLGFKINRRDDEGWPYKDMFGETTYDSTTIDYMKNGCKISFVI